MSHRPGFSKVRRTVAHTRFSTEDEVNDHLELGKRLGAGAYGVVFLATRLKDQSTWAVKVVNKEKAGSYQLKLLERELTILKKIAHENIIHLEEVFETASKMYMVFELCDAGDLGSILQRKNLFSEETTKRLVANIASAVSYLHFQEIVHRDLKLENILVQSNPTDADDISRIKLTDFGLSITKSTGVDNLLSAYCGTPMYMSPEILDGKAYSQQCDVWALGIMTYLMMSGQFPFHHKSEDGLHELIKSQEVTFEKELGWDEVSEKAKDCVTLCLLKDPVHRISAAEVSNHPWLTGNVSQSQNVLEMMRSFRLESTSSALGVVNSNGQVSEKERKRSSLPGNTSASGVGPGGADPKSKKSNSLAPPLAGGGGLQPRRKLQSPAVPHQSGATGGGGAGGSRLDVPRHGAKDRSPRRSGNRR